MRIMPSVYSQNKPTNFTSNPLYKVNVEKLMPDGTYIKIPALISELSRGCDKDKKAVEIIKDRWQIPSESNYLDAIHYSLVSETSPNRIFCVELINNRPLASRILSLSDISEAQFDVNNKKIVVADHIQSKYPYKAGMKRPYNGAGQLGVYGNIRKAFEEGANRFHFTSAADPFYGHIELTNNYLDSPLSSKRNIFAKKMEEFMLLVEQKYGFKR